MKSEIEIPSLERLQALAEGLASSLVPGLVIGLSGTLGVGKTEFVRRLLGSIGVTERVVSPTFVLESRYDAMLGDTPLPVYHWDLYRLANASQVSRHAPEDLLECAEDEHGLLLIEWPEVIPEVVDLLDIRLMLAFDGSSGESSEGSDPLSVPAEQPRRCEIFAASGRPFRAEKSRKVVAEWMLATR